MHNIPLVEPMLSRGFGHKIRLLAAVAVSLQVTGPVSSALAQSESPLPTKQDEPVSGDADPAGAGTETEKPKIIVSRSACRALVQHVPDDDVAYKPGVDVHGNKVVGADLDGGSDITKSLPKQIEFPVTLDFFEYSGIAVPSGMSGEQSVGKITYRNGRVYFNDQPLGDNAYDDELIAACRAAGFR